MSGISICLDSTNGTSANSTYRNQGTLLKRGSEPSEHVLIYNRGVDPEIYYIADECERGLIKEPIEVEATDESAYLTRVSRLRFGIIHSIEWSVRVEDLGRVSVHHLNLSIARYEKEQARWE